MLSKAEEVILQDNKVAFVTKTFLNFQWEKIISKQILQGFSHATEYSCCEIISADWFEPQAN